MARRDAQETARNFLDDILEQVLGDSDKFAKVSHDLHNDYRDGDQYHHENHVDRDYSLVEAGRLLEELAEYEETDHGLWDGLEPRQAIAAQAAYAYGNAVLSWWQYLISRINEDQDLCDMVEGKGVWAKEVRITWGPNPIEMRWPPISTDERRELGGMLLKAQEDDDDDPDGYAFNVIGDWIEEHGGDRSLACALDACRGADVGEIRRRINLIIYEI
jgi:hypothetical protein